jgi:hypothetical protein
MKNKILIFWFVLLFCLLIVCTATIIKIALSSSKKIDPVSSEYSLMGVVTVTTEDTTETTVETTTETTAESITTNFCGPTTTATTATMLETTSSSNNSTTATRAITTTTISTTRNTTKLATTNLTTTTKLTTKLTTTTAKYTTKPVTTSSSIATTKFVNEVIQVATLKGTYYLPTRAQQGKVLKGGSGRYLIDCSKGDNQVKGSVASSYFYKRYGYNYNGKRTMLYLEVQEYPEMNGYYYLDDSNTMGVNLIDFFFYNQNSCPFSKRGVVKVNTYIVKY